MGGGGKGKQTPTTSPYEAATAEIAKQTYQETTPIREDLLAQMGNFLSGGFDPTKSPLYGPMYANARAGMEGQYGVAKQNILANTPRGGGQTDDLAGLESDRASNIGGLQNTLYGNIFNDILSKTYGVAFNAPQQSMAGFGQAANSYAGRYGAANVAYTGQQKNWLDLIGNTGQGLGAMVGGK